MAQAIARIYAAADKAASAAKEVKGLGYGDSEVFVCGPSAGATKADLAASLSQAGVGKEDADSCADEVLKGRSIVIAHAAFGGGAKVTAALDRFDPIAAPAVNGAAAKKANGTSKPRGPVFTGETKLDEAAPLSSYFKWPTLLNSATPFSDWLNFPTLREFNSSIRLSDNAAPLSSSLGLPVLKDDPTPLSSKMGWEVLKDDPTPLSSKFNLTVLKD
jgi:hypothetical protein